MNATVFFVAAGLFVAGWLGLSWVEIRLKGWPTPLQLMVSLVGVVCGLIGLFVIVEKWDQIAGGHATWSAGAFALVLVGVVAQVLLETSSSGKKFADIDTIGFAGALLLTPFLFLGLWSASEAPTGKAGLALAFTAGYGWSGMIAKLKGSDSNSGEQKPK